MNNKKKCNQKCVTEIETENKENRGFSIIKNEDRTGDGNLLPEVRKKTIKELKRYLQQMGYVNISEISSMINLSRQTTKKLINEITENWRVDNENQIIVQKKWHEYILDDINQNPGTFDKEKRANINLQSKIMDKINSLQKLSQKETALKHRTINLYLSKQNIQEKPTELKLQTDKKDNPP